MAENKPKFYVIAICKETSSGIAKKIADELSKYYDVKVVYAFEKTTDAMAKKLEVTHKGMGLKILQKIVKQLGEPALFYVIDDLGHPITPLLVAYLTHRGFLYRDVYFDENMQVKMHPPVTAIQL